jgi:hypothetical protein
MNQRRPKGAGWVTLVMGRILPGAGTWSYWNWQPCSCVLAQQYSLCNCPGDHARGEAGVAWVTSCSKSPRRRRSAGTPPPRTPLPCPPDPVAFHLPLGRPSPPAAPNSRSTGGRQNGIARRRQKETGRPRLYLTTERNTRWAWVVSRCRSALT